MWSKSLIIVLANWSVFYKYENEEDIQGHKTRNVTSVKLFLTSLENFTPGKFLSTVCAPDVSSGISYAYSGTSKHIFSLSYLDCGLNWCHGWGIFSPFSKGLLLPEESFGKIEEQIGGEFLEKYESQDTSLQ